MLPSPFLYVPIMHPAFLPKNLPSGLSLFCPGLTGPASGRTPQHERVSVWQPEMPYSAAEVRACLDSFQRLIDAAERGVPLRSRLADADRPALDGGEEQALRNFVRESRGQACEMRKDERPLETARRAQRLLLLAWMQEEQVLDMESALRRCQISDLAMTAAFGQAGQEGQPVPEADLTADLEADARTCLPPWRMVLEQMAFFLPPQVDLFTADSRMLEELEDLTADAGPATDVAEGRAREITAPLWRVLGHAAPSAHWLDAERRLILWEHD